jgi:PAS domain S-box-containing protein
MKTPATNVIPDPMSVSCREWLDVLDELNVGAFTVDLGHHITAINHCAQALLGLRAGEVLQRDCREIFTGVPCMVNCIVSGGRGAARNHTRMPPADEGESTHQVTRIATLIYTPDRRVAGCLTILQDHSPISDLIDQLRYEERSLKNILDSLDIGVFTVNRGGLITFFNTTAESISGYSRTQVLGQPCSAIFDNETAADVCLLKEAIGKGLARSSRRGKLIDKEGGSVPIRASYMALRNEKDAVIGGLATFQDMTLVQQLNQAIHKHYTFADMIGKSPPMQRIFEMIPVVAASTASVLIEGPTGTGKDLLAKIIHSSGPRAGKAWVKINCAAIPESLLESEFFGYVKGAFTGADRDKPGRFQEADGGTIFLDEIGDLPLALQAKLLRVLEDKEFYPLGGRHTLKVDVRIISATNRQLDELVAKRQFREDLFYRLNVVRMELPPLAERPDDLPLLIRHTLRRLCSARALQLPAIAPDALQILLNYAYPGNVREMENMLEHALILSPRGPLQAQHLPGYVQFPKKATRGVQPSDIAAADPSAEARTIMDALERFDGHRGKAARALGMDRSTLWRKMRRWRVIE